MSRLESSQNTGAGQQGQGGNQGLGAKATQVTDTGSGNGGFGAGIGGAGRFASFLPDASHRRMTPSQSPERICLPSALNATHRLQSILSLSLTVGLPAATSQS